MSLQILVAHTGERIECADPVPNSLEAFRGWIAQATKIPPNDQVLLTSKGKPVRLQALLTENELFLYDRILFTQATARDGVSQHPIPEFKEDDVPAELGDQNSLRAWQALFKKRRDWAATIWTRAREQSVMAEQYIKQRSVIDEAGRVAAANLESRVRNLEQKFNEAKVWLEEIVKDVGSAPQTLEDDMARLSSIPAKPSFSRFFGGIDISTPKSSRKASITEHTLASFVDYPTVKKAAAVSETTIRGLSQHLDTFGESVDNILRKYDDLSKAITLNQSRSVINDPEEPAKLLQDIEAVANKVAADCERVLGFSLSDVKAPAAASKIALLHTRNFLPNIQEYSREMHDLVRNAIEQRNTAVLRLVENLQSVADGESSVAAINKGLANLQVPEDGHAAIDQLSSVTKMPFNYGSLLIEAVRRYEWADKMKRDSSSLAEELAGYQDEEQRRRRKWVKTMNNVVYDITEGRAVGVEINLQGEDDAWPNVTRQDIDDYINALQAVDGMKDVVDSLVQMVRELDRPTRQQLKRAKAFKMGSVHEAGFGQGSLLLRGDDEAKLKEANSKLEDELKSHKSRIRKLEDLLHRQSHVGRLSLLNGSPSGNFQDPSTPVDQFERPLPMQSPRQQEETSRRSSISSRRISNQLTPMEDKQLVRRITQLEAELVAERVARAATEKEVEELKRANATARRLEEESNDTKKDLMENMEAQQREFANERRALEQEKRQLQDELERVQGSRDNERTGVDEQMQAIMAEIELTKKEAAQHIQGINDQLRYRDEIELERQLTLKGIFATLAPDQLVAEDPVKLLQDLEELAQRTVDHSKDLANAVALVKSENENLTGILEGRKKDVAEMQSLLERRDADIRKQSEELDAERQKTASLATQLEEANVHLEHLRTKFADGETGSEALRKQLAEEESKVLKLSTKLAAANSHVNSLDVELSSLQSKYRQLQDVSDNARTRLLERSERAKEISQRLYAYNDRLYRLLDTCGFVVSHDLNNNMVVQRASRTGSSTVMTSDTTDGLRKSSSSAQASRLLEDLSDLSSLLWMEKDSPEEEAAKYEEFKEKLSLFNLDVFCDCISKRMRDIEHTARKWQKEARNYRDKAHKYQHEAHEKIAFRSFKEGDLALFLPTRNQATRPWAAFNVGAPHYFLREQESHKLSNKEWLVARITKAQERVVDLSKAMESARAAAAPDRRSIAESEGGVNIEDDNPFDLSDGLRWYLLDAQEEKPGAPGTPGLGKSIATATTVDARGSIRMMKKRPGDAVEEVNRQLSKSLDSRRSSTQSKASAKGAIIAGIAGKGSSEALRPGSKASSRAVGPSSPAGAGSAEEHTHQLQQTQNAEEQESELQQQTAHVKGISSNGSPLKPLPAEPAATGRAANTSPVRSPVKAINGFFSISKQKSSSALSGSAVGSATSSPSKQLSHNPAASQNASPSKTPAKRTGIWDSLWQLDISLESGKKAPP